MERFRFPVWLDRMLPVLAGCVALLGVYIIGVVYVGASPYTLDVGYTPEQPVPFSHALHAGKLKMDCRYCHNTVEHAASAAIPPTATCIKCHSGKDASGTVPKTAIHSASVKLLPVRESYATGQSIPWTKVHDLPDYAYFNHSAHVRRGVSCVSCHGRIDKMEVVGQSQPLSMAWCLDCHRNPVPNLRPLDQVTNLAWTPQDEGEKETAETVGARVLKELHLQTKQSCSTCHR